MFGGKKKEKQLVFLICMTLCMEDKIFNLFIIFKGKTIFLKSIENTHQGLNRSGMRNIIMNEMHKMNSNNLTSSDIILCRVLKNHLQWYVMSCLNVLGNQGTAWHQVWHQFLKKSAGRAEAATSVLGRLAETWCIWAKSAGGWASQNFWSSLKGSKSMRRR